MNARRLWIISGLFGISGVGLGAFGAHALKDRLAASGMAHAWDTAVQYQLLHTLALLALAATSTGDAGLQNQRAWAARCWTTGTLFFSGSLYLLALGGPR